MKYLFLTLIATVAVSAQGVDKVSTISCPMTEEFEGKTATITVEFLVQNLGSSKAELIHHPLANPDMGAILVTPDEVDGHYSNMSHLNGQGGDLRVSADRIRLFGDGDGYTLVDLVLYKNTDYKKGYVRVYGSGDQTYQKISCSVK